VEDQTLELVSRSLAGDEAAFEALYATSAGRVMAYLVRSGFGNDEAQDLTQETFIRVFKSLHTFERKRGSFRVWLSMIARNVARRHWARRKQPEHFDPDLAEQIFAAPRDASQSPEALEETQAVRECVEQLPPELGRVIRMRYVEGRSTRGIAAAMDMPEATVRLRLKQARERVAACLRANGILS